MVHDIRCNKNDFVAKITGAVGSFLGWKRNELQLELRALDQKQKIQDYNRIMHQK